MPSENIKLICHNMSQQRRRSRSETITPETFSIWTSYTDLMSNAFMVLTLLLLLSIATFSLNNQDRRNKPDRSKAEKIIVLPASQYNFASGSAVLPKNLQEAISKNGKDGYILKAIEKNLQEFESAARKVDVIEVIGHTDGQELGSAGCNAQTNNLDTKLEEVASGDRNVAILCPGSNTDLGLIRALAVVKELQKVQRQKKDGGFRKLSFRAYSAAQLLLPNNQGFATVNRNPNSQRRRIEIRFAQFGEVEEIKK